MTMQRKMARRAIGLAVLVMVLFIVLIIMTVASPALHAAEGGLGRPVTGMQIAPFAGVIPPDPGFLWSFGYVYYSGELGGSAQAPVGGELSLGLDASASFFTATGVYIWDTPKGRWNYASMLTVSWVVLDASADAVLGNRSVSLADDTSDLYDLFFAPIIASYHVSETEHWSFALYVYAPTAEFEPGRLVDNLGYGELGVYGGGPTRGAPTPRIDKLAGEGLRLTNMNMEAQCTPSRSSIMTGRFAIRSGTHSVPFGGVADGLTQWEITMAESLSAAGYATALYGKWHLGSQDGRLPNDQGFDEWYGIPRTTDESLWPGSPGYSPAVMPPEQILEGRKGEKSQPVKVYDVEQRRLIGPAPGCPTTARSTASTSPTSSSAKPRPRTARASSSGAPIACKR